MMKIKKKYRKSSLSIPPAPLSPTYIKHYKKLEGLSIAELAFTFVLLGLVIGVTFVGEDMMIASAIRSQITQIEKYQTLVDTFKTKYSGKLPGDMDAKTASQYGLTPRGGGPGDGDGNGVIEGLCNGGQTIGAGETSLFWNDLTMAGLLLDEKFMNNTENYITTTEASHSNGFTVKAYLPPAEIGHGNFVYVWSGGYGIDRITGGQGGWSDPGGCGLTDYFKGDNINYFGLSRIPQGIMFGVPNAAQGLTVHQAYSIDKKMDDGMPQSGRVLAMYPNNNATYPIIWAQVSNTFETAPIPSNTAPNPGAFTTCFDNSDPDNDSGTPGVAGGQQHYSTEINKGKGINCALSFEFE